MECNKDEAIRAKQLAEKKLTEEDILGAKRLALKAQSLFPGLEGLSQFQEILDVYASSQKRVNGEVDWYEILGVDPLADNETIKKKFRKLALALHPDKNKSVGADGAFKIIYEAWSLLSDKAKRDAYNERRNIRAAYEKARYGNPPTEPGKSTSKNSTHSSSKPRNPTAQEKSQQDTKASYEKDKGKTSPNNAGKSKHTSFTNSSSSTKNSATQGKPQQETRPSNEKDRGPSTTNPATQDKPRQETRPSNEKDRGPSTKNPATQGKSRQETRPSYEKDRGPNTKRDAYNEWQNIRASYEGARDANPPADPRKSTSKNFTHSSSKPRDPTAQGKSQQDTKACYEKGKGKTSPNNAGKSKRTSFTNSSSSTKNPATQGKPQKDTWPSNEKDRGPTTTNPATLGKPRQEARPLFEKDRTRNSVSVAGKSRFDNFTSSSSKKNLVTPDDVQQDTRTSYLKAAHQDTPAGDGKSGYNTFSNGASSTRNVVTAKHSHTVPSAPCGVNSSKTFWTSCKACKKQYEYVHIYRDKKILCPTCRKPFTAREMPPPHSMDKRSSTKVPCRQKQQDPIHNSFDTSSNSGRKSTRASGHSSFKSMGRTDIPPVSTSRHDDARSESRSVTSAGQPGKNFQFTNVNLKRRHEQKVDVTVNEETLCEKRTAPVKLGSDIGSNFAEGEMAAKKRRT